MKAISRDIPKAGGDAFAEPTRLVRGAGILANSGKVEGKSVRHVLSFKS